MVNNMKSSKHIKLKVDNIKENNDSYNIDYDIFTTEEIIKIINFYNNVLKYVKHKVSFETLKMSYLEYRMTINSIALEKRYNKDFYDKTGISIYHLMKNLNYIDYYLVLLKSFQVDLCADINH